MFVPQTAALPTSSDGAMCDDRTAYAKSERQRCPLRLVCTSWKQWVDSMVGRVITLGFDRLPTPTIRCARKVEYHSKRLELFSMPTRWERLKIHSLISSVESVLNALS